ncbi:DUF2264 domain-containing protein [Aureimonas leprariae]|uniref:DUF2264 domain-containing protein n=1 Tax=Plantimonas leprariae TaxID=2615207 RepID=A0A7V7PRK9_9HYPH|nr:DUF2264 domain-containing protein [Aureimonas leprariae]KAB0681357.1 DUF2264 domain-containing protein [Aureimonas leprariae]
MSLDPVRFNPLHGNPLIGRDDVERALLALFEPLLPFFSEGRARVRLDAAGAHFDRAAADLEGFARPLWGLAPHFAGGGTMPHWPLFAAGLANGVDPDHPDYWGQPRDRDQRLVELAALGFALRLAPEKLWDPLTGRQRDRLARYLLDARERAYAPNNWKFFRVMVDAALDRLGLAYDRSLTEAYLAELDGFHIAGGWYRDGDFRRVDHYIPFAMHFYGLIHARFAGAGDPYAERFRERARSFAKDFRSWFDEDGGALAFGRSMTYRFACGGFWAALAFAEEEALPWGEIKGLWLRHLRWWADKPIAHPNGVLSVGYGYPQLTMSESYNSAGSPYWALKAFLPLALPADHPFWRADETPLAPGPDPLPLAAPGMVMTRHPGTVVALSSGQENLQMRSGPEKYAKFAYASRYGFSVEVDERGFERNAFDNTLALSEDGLHYRVRETNETALIAGHALRAVWKPWPGVRVETTLLPAGRWHVRLHRIRSDRPLRSAEGGFAIARGDDGDGETTVEAVGRAAAITPGDLAAIVDLGSTVSRGGRAQKALPNTGLLAAKTTVPQLRGSIPAGETLLACAVLASGDGAAGRDALDRPPALPSLADLDALFRADGVAVGAVEAPGDHL